MGTALIVLFVILGVVVTVLLFLWRLGWFMNQRLAKATEHCSAPQEAEPPEPRKWWIFRTMDDALRIVGINMDD